MSPILTLDLGGYKPLLTRDIDIRSNSVSVRPSVCPSHAGIG